MRRWAKKKLDMRIRKFYLKPWDGGVLWPMKYKIPRILVKIRCLWPSYSNVCASGSCDSGPVVAFNVVRERVMK